MLAIVAAIGFYDGFFGPCTGYFLATVLAAFFGMGLVLVTAHTKFQNLASNVAALIALTIGGKVPWALGLLMRWPASLAAGWSGRCW